jgi:hypothetical protein
MPEENDSIELLQEMQASFNRICETLKGYQMEFQEIQNEYQRSLSPPSKLEGRGPAPFNYFHSQVTSV